MNPLKRHPIYSPISETTTNLIDVARNDILSDDSENEQGNLTPISIPRSDRSASHSVLSSGHDSAKDSDYQQLSDDDSN